MLTFTLCPDVFPVEFGVMIGEWDDKEANNMASSLGLDPERIVTRPPSHGAAVPVPNGALIWLDRCPHTTDELGLLSHEALHAVFITGRELGFGVTAESEEWFCYMVQYIVQNTLEHVAEWEEAKKKPARKRARKTASK